MKFAKLRGRIYEKYKTAQEFSDRLGISQTTLARKLNGKNEFTIQEINTICKLLDIGKADLVSYFFE